MYPKRGGPESSESKDRSSLTLVVPVCDTEHGCDMLDGPAVVVVGGFVVTPVVTTVTWLASESGGVILFCSILFWRSWSLCSRNSFWEYSLLSARSCVLPLPRPLFINQTG